MIERKWLRATNPSVLLELLQGKASNRKLRLAACACCRHVVYLCIEDGNIAVDVAERFADGQASYEELAAAKRALSQYIKHGAEYVPWLMTSDDGYEAACGVVAAVPTQEAIAVEISIEASGPDSGSFFGTPDEARSKATSSCVGTIRDIFGNPFRPVAVDLSWLTSTVVSLAQQMYESRDFAPMPVLADALQDAGCDHPDILAHCRDPGPHVRGCWVVDLLLGKE